MLKSELKNIVNSAIYKRQAMREFMSTWDLLKIKDFHLNSDFIVIDKQELQAIVTEVVHETITALRDADSNDPERRCLARYNDGKI